MTPEPLAPFLEFLQASGLEVGIDDRLAVCRLLEAEARWDRDRLRWTLRPVLARSLEQQAIFDQAFDAFFPVLQGPSSERQPERRTEAESGPTSTARPAPSAGFRPRWWMVLLSAVVLISVFYLLNPPGQPGEEASAPAEPAPKSAPRAEAGVLPDRAARGGAERPPAPADAPMSWWWLALGGLAVPGLIGAALWLLRRPRPALLQPPLRWQLRLAPAAGGPLLGIEQAEDIAAEMSERHQGGRGERLDVAKTLEATVARGGYPSLVYQRPPAAPRYAVLLDQSQRSEALSGVFEGVLDELRRAGVRLDRYTFTGSPAVCWAHGRSRPLEALLSEDLRALIIIGDAATATDPDTGMEAAWGRTLREFPQRLWLNTTAGEESLRGAWLLRHRTHTPTHPATPSALVLFHPDLLQTDGSDVGWPAVLERDPTSEVGLTRLRRDLGQGFAVLCALARLPDRDSAAALWVVENFFPSLSLEHRTRLLAIPWLREWPEEVTPVLSAVLESADPGLVELLHQEALAELMRQSPPVGTGAHLHWQLQRAELLMEAQREEALQILEGLARQGALGQELAASSSALRGRLPAGLLSARALLSALDGLRAPPPTEEEAREERPPPPPQAQGWAASGRSLLSLSRGAVISGRYEVERALGGGHIGETYLVRHLKSEKHVVLKLLHANLQKEDVSARLQQDFKAARAIHHRRIIRYGELSEHSGQPYCIVEYFKAQSLRELIEEYQALQQSFTLQEAFQITEQILEGLEAIHETGRSHGNLKPENVLVETRRTGPGGKNLLRSVKLTDHGMHGLLQWDEVDRPAYVAPEIGSLWDNHSMPISDIFSVGVILYEILVGQAPRGTYFSPTQLRDDLPEMVDDIVEIALAANAEDRYPSAADMRRHLRYSLSEPVEQVAPSFKRVLIATGLGIALVGGVGVYISAQGPDHLWRARQLDEQLHQQIRHVQLPESEPPATPPEGMVFVPGGPFIQGRMNQERREAFFSTEPAARIQVTGAYFIDAFPRFNGSGAVTWDEASAQCRQEGLQLCTGLEWEKACKGPESTIYPYGDVFDSSACASNLGCTSGYGIRGLGIGLAEWTASIRSGAERRYLIKGGGRLAPRRRTRCAFGLVVKADASYDNTAFRCCLSAE